MTTTVKGAPAINHVLLQCAPHRAALTSKKIALLAFADLRTSDPSFVPVEMALREKLLALNSAGFTVSTTVFPTNSSAQQIKEEIDSINADVHTVGVVVHRPIPSALQSAILHLNPKKDLDAVTGSASYFKVSAVTEAVLRLVDKASPSNQVAVVGAKGNVGSEIATQLKLKGIPVVEIDDGDDLSAVSGASIVISCVGKPNLISEGHLSATNELVIDVGYFAMKSGASKIVSGDISRRAYSVPSMITPVPGGVGPLQIATLIERATYAATGFNMSSWSA